MDLQGGWRKPTAFLLFRSARRDRAVLDCSGCSTVIQPLHGPALRLSDGTEHSETRTGAFAMCFARSPWEMRVSGYSQIADLTLVAYPLLVPGQRVPSQAAFPS